MEPKEKKAFEPSGLVPRSIVRTFERFRQQLLPGSETAAIREYRISRYQVLVSARCLFTLLIIPIATNWLVSSWLLSPLVEHFWNTQQNEIFLNSYQEERAFAELESFSEKLFFESLLNTTNTINVNFTPYVQKFSSSESQPFAYPVRVRGMTCGAKKMYAKEALQLYQSSTLQGICTESSVTNSFLPKTNLCNLNLKNSSAFEPTGVKALSETWDIGVRDIASSTLSNVGQCAYLLPLQGIGLVLNVNDLNEYSIKNLREPYVHGVPQIGQIGIPFFQTHPTTTNLLTNSETFLPNLRFGLVPQLLEIENERTVHKSSIFRGTPTQSKATDSVGVKAFSKVWGIQSKEGHKSLICPCTTHFTKQRGQGCSYQQEQRGTHSSASNSSIASIVLPQRGIKGSTLATAGGKPLVIAGDKFVEVYGFGKASSLLSVPLGSTYDNSLKIKEKVQNKILELAIYYNQQTIISITNIVGDVVSLMTLGCLFIWMKPEITILKSFLIEAIYSLSDTTKSFLLILLTDLLVGFHSPRGWETALELLLKHFGLPENQDFVFLFVATFPVLLDTVFKYWIFRHLNKISPSTVATYHSMIE